MPNIILIIHIKNIKTIIGIKQEVINNIAIASIKLLNACSPFFTSSDTLSPIFDIPSLNLDNKLSSLSFSCSSATISVVFALLSVS